MQDPVAPVPGRAALLTIDVQNDFVRPGAPAEIEGTAAAVPEMERLATAFRERGRPVVHAVRLYRADGSNVDRCRRRAIAEGEGFVTPGTEGAEVVEELKPAPEVRLDGESLLRGQFQTVGSSEWVVYKPRWSAFYETALATFLRTREVNTVVVCGCNFPNCPRATIYDASERDFRIVFVPDATSGVYERGVEELRDIGVAVRDTDATVDWLDSTAP